MSGTFTNVKGSIAQTFKRAISAPGRMQFPLGAA